MLGITRTVAMTALMGTIAWAAAPAGKLQKQTLVLPVTLPASRGQDGAELRCAVSYGPAVGVCALAFSSDGKQLYTGGYREVLAWDMVEGKLARRIGAGQLGGPVRAITLADSGRLLIAGEGIAGRAGAVHLFDLKTGKLAASFTEPRDVVQCLAVSPDGKFLAAGAAGAAEPNVHVWSLRDRKLAATLPGHGDGVTGVSFSPDGKSLATGGAAAQLRIWETEGWKEDFSVPVPEPITDAAFSPNGELVVVAVAGPGEWAIRVHRMDDTKAKEARVFYSGGAAPLRIVWSHKEADKGKKLYVACGDNTIKAITGGGGAKPAAVMYGHADWVCGLTVSPDGTRIASGSLDGTVRLWNEADGRALAVFVQLAPGRDEWLVATPSGFLATSSPAAVQWRAKGLATPAADLAAAFNNPESVRKVLAGDKIASPLSNDSTVGPDDSGPGQRPRPRQQQHPTGEGANKR